MTLEELLKAMAEDGADKSAILTSYISDASATAVSDSTSGLKNTNSKLLAQVAAFKKTVAGIPEGFDADEYATMLAEHEDKKTAKMKAEERWGELQTALEQKHREALEAQGEEMAALKAALSTQLIDNTAQVAISAQGGNAALLLPHFKAHLKMVTDDDGGYVASVVDARGETRHSLLPNTAGKPMGMKELVAEFKANEIYAPAFEAPNSGGGAGGSGSGGFNGKNPFKKGEGFNYTEQARMTKTNPELAAQMKVSAAA